MLSLRERGFMEIRDRIKDIRISIGLTQAKFAERIAISNSYISELENGTKEANERILRLVATEFNVNEHWLRTGQGVMFNEGLNAQVSEAMSMFKSLDQHFQSGALKILSVLSDICRDYNHGN